MTNNNGRFWIKKIKKPDRIGPDRAVLLCRQSITRVGSVSLEEQEENNQKYADSKGYQTVQVLHSPNLKGWKEERADHDAILELAATSGVEVVVSYDVSRTARTVRKMEMLAYDLEELGCRLEFSAQPFANSAQGRQLIATFAELETAARSVRLTDVWAFLRNKGRWHGVAPFGYKRLDKTIVIDETEAPIVRMIYGWAMSGKGTTWIATELHNTQTPTRNGGTWGQVHLSRLLRNPAYAGGMRINGVTVFPPEGLTWHEPMFTRDEWDRLQAILPDRPPVIRTKAVSSWLEGLIEHACGCRMHLIGTTTPRSSILRVFRCAHRYKPPKCPIPHSEVSAVNVETAARRALITDLLTIPTVESIQRSIVTEHKTDGSLMARRRIEKARDALEREMRRIEHTYHTGRRDEVWFAAEDDRIKAKLAALDTEERSLPQPIVLSALRDTATVLACLSEIIEETDDDDLMLILRQLEAVVVVGEGGCWIRYHPRYAKFLSPVKVKIPRARTR